MTGHSSTSGTASWPNAHGFPGYSNQWSGDANSGYTECRTIDNALHQSETTQPPASHQPWILTRFTKVPDHSQSDPAHPNKQYRGPGVLPERVQIPGQRRKRSAQQERKQAGKPRPPRFFDIWEPIQNAHGSVLDTEQTHQCLNKNQVPDGESDFEPCLQKQSHGHRMLIPELTDLRL